ncbi:hypothetical protein A3F23_02195 [Candidatus Giovannonibacteria bacterium RIFCSPHIGHO2_12_FULL_43_15]|uniref:Glycosyltransferase RgtA/B/C/D-like domain-containing protein n=1 Tax=Candidatus Giovannonibacteria bacterium RIFCSPHIGHO2_12_FULL_43_15 TaxID=1798341 RepID=A0A1F5WR07_9BACT|nr:MAG: hypothetical protein A3F23_02195 [Candidatus Giovannonibacteria bacterium RIFCSPHIGHO2_12_FULL_43_15]
MKKELIIIGVILLLGLSLYSLTLRGEFGNPGPGDFKNNLDQAARPFELSPERGRYVHIVNLAERGKYDLSQEWAEVAYPDVGISNGKYYSYFAPGTSYFALPFYLLGAKFNLAQVAVFFAEILVSIISLVFIYKIAKNVFSLTARASLFSVLVFAFASTAWSYSVTLYQHAFTVLFMTTAFYAAWKFAKESGWRAWLYASWVWVAYALSITVDYPNVILMLPIMVYFAYSTFSVKKLEEGFSLTIKWAAVATFLVFALITGLHFWHNAHYYGSWHQLAGGLQSYRHPDEIANNASASAGTTKNVATFFSERAIPHGFYILLFSDERGLFFFYPIFALSLFGIWAYSKKSREGGVSAEYILAVALILTNLTLYSSWGDPWGGWAYGPRYLIPSMAFLSIFVGVFISSGAYTGLKKFLAFLLFLYSSAVALLGALTTNAVPTRGEAMLLPIKKYNFLKNIDFIYSDQSGSFIYKTYLSGKLSLVAYYLIIYIAIALVVALVLIASRDKKHG